jgi:Mlc titration factor MtfA (ptsG expression regulator)
MSDALIIIIVTAVFAVLFFVRKKKTVSVENLAIPDKWRSILLRRIHFYSHLDKEKRVQFEHDVIQFLNAVRITGVKTEVMLEDRLLVASSAIIPLFGFPAWTYSHLDEVLLYPDSFDRNYNIGSKKEMITGMVGSGPMEGKVILSKPSLRMGFDIANDKKNVGIHEFVHLFDKETGSIDGIPPGFEDKAYALPWLDFVKQKIEEIVTDRSDINDYGATNRQEFFAVASEYFFERPHLLKRKHPQLYGKLSKVFNQDMTAIIDPASFQSKQPPSRNAPCPCGSGLKYKRCCIS